MDPQHLYQPLPLPPPPWPGPQPQYCYPVNHVAPRLMEMAIVSSYGIPKPRLAVFSSGKESDFLQCGSKLTLLTKLLVSYIDSFIEYCLNQQFQDLHIARICRVDGKEDISTCNRASAYRTLSTRAETSFSFQSQVCHDSHW